MSSPKAKPGSPLQSTRQMLDELDSLMERMLSLPVGGEDLPPLPRDVPMTPIMTATLTPPLAEQFKLPDLEDLSETADELPGFDEELPRADEELPAIEDELPAESDAADEELARQEADLGASLSNRLLAFQSLQDEAIALDGEEEVSEPEVVPPESALEIDPPQPVKPAAPTTAVSAKATGAGSDDHSPLGRSHLPDGTMQPSPKSRSHLPDGTLQPAKREGPARQAGRTGFWRLPLLPLLGINLAFDACSTLLGPMGSFLHSQRGRNLLGILGLFCMALAGAWLVFDHFSGR